ncbi:trypsin-like peptidase domain-containing protein [Micromonospora sp. WMMA1998]|uniref:trypsin-like peptidase domain-containing protein n=1 Tax=Micromonospora sp. WMMA1998 TaxID=3015167 RepID=UPI00248C2E68|nr:trypsin-like peptidase domain-containing protein [Micromonospora sp. WMMA1998]WBC14739.1 trypsin-like peptidase domain-containing protein [Micromonospora sp. WMMA1998]
MAGGYGTGEPGRDGDGTADRPGPLPPRMAPPGAATPFPGHPAPPPATAGPDPARDAAAGYRPASGATYPDPAGQPGYDAGHRPAGGTYPGRPDLPGTAHPSARAGASVVPVQPTPAAPHPTAGASYPAQPSPGPSSSAQPASWSSYPGQPTSGPVYPGQSGSGSAYPAQPTSGPAYPGQPASGPAYSGQSASGPGYAAYPGQAPGGFGVPPVAHPDRSGRRGRLPVVALVLAGVLAVVTGVQAYQIHRLDDRLAAADRRTAEAQGADARRLDGLEQRAGSLEKQAGAAFNPEAVASAVLPSVFRVRAGQFTGTAFAVGKAPAGGGTTLLTNFHVVEAVFTAGERKVFLERTDQRFEATIVATDKEKDLAQLRTTAKFSGLVAARTPVKSGQQIVVVGAPLGLQDSVTTGVVSAFRKDEGGSGPVIQFDAPINPGNSGGPVINGSKEVVGIATAKARDAEGIGLAVPIKTACDRFKLC